MPKIGCYVRVSTADQILDRQINSTTEYAADEFGAGPDQIEIFRDKSTGTNTNRDGYREMMAAAEDGEVRAVVVHEISRLARSLQDLEVTVGRITDNGVEVHFVRDGLAFGDDKARPMQRLQMQMLGAFSEWQARVKQLNTKEGIQARREADEEYHHGRPPLGFDKDDGALVRGDNYDEVVAVLDMVQKGNLSKRKAADELDCARSTIRSALEKSELYGL